MEGGNSNLLHTMTFYLWALFSYMLFYVFLLYLVTTCPVVAVQPLPGVNPLQKVDIIKVIYQF